MAEGPENVEGGALARSLFGAITVVSILEAQERRKLREVDEQRQGRFGRKARRKPRWKARYKWQEAWGERDPRPHLYRERGDISTP